MTHILSLLDGAALQSPAWVQAAVIVFTLPHTSQGTSVTMPFILGRKHLGRVASLGPLGSYSPLSSSSLVHTSRNSGWERDGLSWWCPHKQPHQALVGNIDNSRGEAGSFKMSVIQAAGIYLRKWLRSKVQGVCQELLPTVMKVCRYPRYSDVVHLWVWLPSNFHPCAFNEGW